MSYFDSTSSDTESEGTSPDVPEAAIGTGEQTQPRLTVQKALSESNVDDLEAEGEQCPGILGYSFTY